MVPEQEVPDELVVTEVASIDSEKVTEMDEVNDRILGDETLLVHREVSLWMTHPPVPE